MSSSRGFSMRFRDEDLLCPRRRSRPVSFGPMGPRLLKRPRARGRISRLPSDYLRKLYFDSIAHSEHALRFLIDLVGPEQVMIGTDYPFDMGPDRPVRFIDDASSLTSEEKRLITSQNARCFLGLDP